MSECEGSFTEWLQDGEKIGGVLSRRWKVFITSIFDARPQVLATQKAGGWAKPSQARQGNGRLEGELQLDLWSAAPVRSGADPRRAALVLVASARALFTDCAAPKALLLKFRVMLFGCTALVNVVLAWLIKLKAEKRKKIALPSATLKLFCTARSLSV